MIEDELADRHQVVVPVVSADGEDPVELLFGEARGGRLHGVLDPPSTRRRVPGPGGPFQQRPELGCGVVLGLRLARDPGRLEQDAAVSVLPQEEALVGVPGEPDPAAAIGLDELWLHA
jgi:hypothetical protein